jgi:hypothetical protein
VTPAAIELMHMIRKGQLGSLHGLYKIVGVDGPTASSARIGAVSNQDRSCP